MASIQSTPSTPPPSSLIRAPPTPKHGAFHDHWETFSPRKSARLSAKQSSAARTPSPSSQQQSARRLQQFSPRTANKTAIATMASPTASPIKKHSARAIASKYSPTESATSGLKIPPQLQMTAGMLFTPTKTPSNKRNVAAADTNIQPIARNIFRSSKDEIHPASTKRRTKQYKGISLESFIATEVEEDIQVHVDSQNRIPQVDASADNPFYGDGPRPGATNTRLSRKRAVINIPGEGQQSIDDVVGRDDGMVYVFRGMKKYRKFGNTDDPSQSRTSSEVSPSRTSARRLLFPPKHNITPMDEADEEAPTDIEENDNVETESSRNKHIRFEMDEKDKDTALATVVDVEPVTPKAPNYALASPHTTSRAIRSKPTSGRPTPSRTKNSFDTWRKTKNSAQAQKRQAESSVEQSTAKRARI